MAVNRFDVYFMFHIPKIALENSSTFEMTAGKLMSFVIRKNAIGDFSLRGVSVAI